jgi:anti-sigma-K factor RskA
VALLGLGAVAFLSWHEPPRTWESTLKAHSGLQFWTVAISKDGQHMTVHAPGLASRPLGYRYQLWAWPERGEPVSLVPLPVQGQSVYDLTPDMQQALTRAGRVAVIVEASGPRKGPPRVILVAPLEASTARL